ncbi:MULTISPECIES: cupin domain-containing protein [Pseudomonas]|uniref:cupin domain-containing protein n=1 Tax=Pseudomonas TaxID=286 RepID=UPI000AFB3418|nr:cupin domain-containing protein [Pseudomonas sp. HMSC08G10]
MAMPALINADLRQTVIVQGHALPWIPSPQAGVERRLLFRIGQEQARATSLVRYAPGSRFNAHAHPGGEEFLVLEGVFEDEQGQYPAGSYVRNPPGSRHSPGSAQGCVIFVHLRQFHPEDHERVVAQVPDQGDRALWHNMHERVWVQQARPGQTLEIANPRGLELFVLDGQLRGDGFALRPWSWMRLPPGAAVQAVAGDAGARIWIKDAALDLTAC